MTRWHKRKHDAETANIVRKAKVDMARWLSLLPETPSELEVKAWQSGYVSGINRAVGQEER